MKQVSSEREKIRARERERLAKSGKASLRPEAKPFMSRIVEGFSASKWLGTETAKHKLAMAGYRGQSAEVTFLFFRLISPAIGFNAGAGLRRGLRQPRYGHRLQGRHPVGGRLCRGSRRLKSTWSNVISKRQKMVRQAFPDTLDLLAHLRRSRHVARTCGPQGRERDR